MHYATTPEGVRRLLRQIIEGNSEERAAAWLVFVYLEEEVVQPLANELYSGVDDPTGIAILELLGEIGTSSAQMVLLDIYCAGARKSLVKAAARGLARNL